jgi:hypothetical protein
MNRINDESGVLGELDSHVFFEIPQEELRDFVSYQFFLKQIVFEWMNQFNGNTFFPHIDVWNDENPQGIYGRFGGIYRSSKFNYQDGTRESIGNSDVRGKRGLLIREHWGGPSVEKVHHIADNLEDFLKQIEIEYTRINRRRASG